MKKIIFFCLLFSGCAALQPKQPSVTVDNHSFVLTSAYTGAEGPVNIYTSQEVPGAELTVSRIPAVNPELRQITLDMTRQLFQATGMTEDQYQITSKEEDGLFVSRVAFVAKNNPDKQYSFSLSQDGKDKQTSLISFKTPAGSSQEQPVQAYQRLLPELEKFMSLPLYATRPGHGKPDDSPDLQKLKNFLAAPYRPQRRISRQGSITSIESVDDNQLSAFDLISNSDEPDVSAWLDKHIADYSPKFLYAMMIRAARRQEPVEKTLFWMKAALLRTASDAILCKDRFVSQYLTVLSMELIPAIQPYISSEEWQEKMKDPQLQEQTFQEVIAWDKKHPQKNSPQWFCNSGHAVSTSEAYPKKEWKKRRKKYRKWLVENTQKIN